MPKNRSGWQLFRAPNWSGRGDSNSRPHGPEPCTLTWLSYFPRPPDSITRSSEPLLRRTYNGRSSREESQLSRRTTASPRARRSTPPTRAGADLLALASAPRPIRKVPSSRRNRSVLREVIDTLDGTVQGVVERGRHGSLDDRDPAFITSQLRWLQPLADIYFRGEVRDIERIPASGPVLIVGNHSGGLATPDTWVFMVNFLRHFGTEREAYALAHNAVMGLPLTGTWLRRVGTLPAHPDAARNALRRGASVLVYPGGDEDVFRTWASATASAWPAAPASSASPCRSACRCNPW